MNKFLIAAGIIAVSALSAGAFSIGGGISTPIGGGGFSIGFGTDGSNAVICSVSDVSVLASSAEDCTAIGGNMTHSIETTLTPAS